MHSAGDEIEDLGSIFCLNSRVEFLAEERDTSKQIINDPFILTSAHRQEHTKIDLAKKC